MSRWPERTPQERFWEKVDRSGDCWVWTANTTPDGYGSFNITPRKPVPAHRLAYEWSVGPIPTGLHVDHLCRNRACVNPEHLEPVTCRENILRGESPSAISVRTNRCQAGHEFTPENTTYWGRKSKRICLQCTAIRNQRRVAS